MSIFDTFERKHDYLVCVDSDGCVMDTMNCKHFHCFGPCMVNEWGLEEWKDEILERWNEINLFSMTRGINRFKGLAMALKEIDAKYTRITGVDALIHWTDAAPALSNDGVARAAAEATDADAKLVLEKALSWSKAVNAAIVELDENLKVPYDGAKEGLAAAHQFADVAMVSSANRDAVEEEWGKFGLLEHTDIVLAQDFIVTHFTNSYSEIRSPKYPFYSPLEICTPPAITFSWTDKKDTGSYTLYIADNIDFENAVEYTTKKTSIDIYNFQPGVKYYWKVVSDSSQSVVFTFSIGKGYTRFLKIDGVQNIRDLGGYKTASGQTVKYGILYRSANMDSITPTGKKELVNRLGVKTDMDFRGDSGPSPLGKDINYIELAIKWYSGIFADAEKLDLIRQTIVEYSKIENYPMCYHCAVGRDRTGTMSFLILGLLGVDEETLVREYYLSMYSAMGSFSESEFNALTDQLFPFISRLHQYGDSDDTISEKIEAFMLDIGVTKEEINSIRSILLEGEPTIDKQEQGCQSGVTAFPIMIILAGFVALKKKATCK